MMIKPDAVQDGNIGAILDIVLRNGFKLLAMKFIRMPRTLAEQLYDVHSEKPFFGELIDFTVSDGVVVAVLEKEDAVAELRRLVGATNPSKAAEGTLRRLFGHQAEANAVHASDSDENAAREAALFFSEADYVYGR